MQDTLEDMGTGGGSKTSSAAKKGGAGDEEMEQGLEELAYEETKASNQILKDHSEVLVSQAEELETIKE